MKQQNLKRIHSSWIAPVTATAVLAVFVPLGLGAASPACETHEISGTGSAHGREAELADSRAADTDREMDAGGEDCPRAESAVSDGHYSDRRIRMLNDMTPVPETRAQLLQEIERLSVQRHRFERRYGPESVAARSVRERLRDLNHQVESGLQYAGQGERGTVDDR